MLIASRQPGFLQGAVLLAGSCLPILGAVLLGPVLAQVQQHFSATPGVEVLTPVMLTIPALESSANSLNRISLPTRG